MEVLIVFEGWFSSLSEHSNRHFRVPKWLGHYLVRPGGQLTEIVLLGDVGEVVGAFFISLRAVNGVKLFRLKVIAEVSGKSIVRYAKLFFSDNGRTL